MCPQDSALAMPPLTLTEVTRQRDQLATALGGLLEDLGLIRAERPFAIIHADLLTHAKTASGNARAARAKPTDAAPSGLENTPDD